MQGACAPAGLGKRHRMEQLLGTWEAAIGWLGNDVRPGQWTAGGTSRAWRGSATVFRRGGYVGLRRRRAGGAGGGRTREQRRPRSNCGLFRRLGDSSGCPGASRGSRGSSSNSRRPFSARSLGSAEPPPRGPRVGSSEPPGGPAEKGSWVSEPGLFCAAPGDGASRRCGRSSSSRTRLLLRFGLKLPPPPFWRALPRPDPGAAALPADASASRLLSWRREDPSKDPGWIRASFSTTPSGTIQNRDLLPLLWSCPWHLCSAEELVLSKIPITTLPVLETNFRLPA